MELIADLRFGFSDFHDNVCAHRGLQGEFWDNVKTRLLTSEARLAALEVRLAGITKEEWEILQPASLVNELQQLFGDLRSMRREFESLVQELPH
jgi:hypothetical protein